MKLFISPFPTQAVLILDKKKVVLYFSKVKKKVSLLFLQVTNVDERYLLEMISILTNLYSQCTTETCLQHKFVFNRLRLVLSFNS